MTKPKKKPKTHAELFFFGLACAKAYYEYVHNPKEEINMRTNRGKMITYYAYYLDQLHKISAKEGVEI
jgi:hypothetical protein